MSAPTASRPVGVDLQENEENRALVEAIAASKSQPLSRLLFGLGIRNIGEKAAYETGVTTVFAQG